MKLTPQLIAALLQLGISVPALFDEISALFAAHDVTPEQEAEARAILDKDPNSFFPPATPATPPAAPPAQGGV